MKHKTLETKTTTTDLGQFTAIAAAYSVDRVKDEIKRGAFTKTIAAWKESGKRIPLHWDHQGEAANVIGWVDPASMKEVKDGLYVAGQVDVKDSEVAREAWRSMKNNAVALSFGYLAKGNERKDGITELTEIDLFEISVVPAPANPDTRFLSLKTAAKQMGEGEMEAEPSGVIEALNDMIDDAQEFIDQENDPADVAVMRRALDALQSLVSAETAEGEKTVSPEVEDGHDEEPERAKSAPQDPLTRQAWEAIARGAYGGPLPRPRPTPEPEPEPEPLDPAALTHEFWALALKPR